MSKKTIKNQLNLIKKNILFLMFVFSTAYSCEECMGTCASENRPIMEITESEIVIKNYPEENTSVLNCVMIHWGICNSKKNIETDGKGIVIIHRSLCEQEAADYCDECNSWIDRSMYGYSTPSDCEWCCDKVTFSATLMCPRFFPAPHCTAACLFVIEVLRETCHWCCAEGNFYKKCIKPFETFLDLVKCPVDPYF